VDIKSLIIIVLLLAINPAFHGKAQLRSSRSFSAEKRTRTAQGALRFARRSAVSGPWSCKPCCQCLAASRCQCRCFWRPRCCVAAVPPSFSDIISPLCSWFPPPPICSLCSCSRRHCKGRRCGCGTAVLPPPIGVLLFVGSASAAAACHVAGRGAV